MVTVKNYTSLEQSKVLNKILSDESADIVYVPTTNLNGNEYYYVNFRNDEPIFEDCIYAWSLAALLSVLPEPSLMQTSDKRWILRSWDKNRYWSIADHVNLVDACYEMIIKLHELKLL